MPPIIVYTHEVRKWVPNTRMDSTYRRFHRVNVVSTWLVIVDKHACEEKSTCGGWYHSHFEPCRDSTKVFSWALSTQLQPLANSIPLSSLCSTSKCSSDIPHKLLPCILKSLLHSTRRSYLGTLESEPVAIHTASIPKSCQHV